MPILVAIVIRKVFHMKVAETQPAVFEEFETRVSLFDKADPYLSQMLVFGERKCVKYHLTICSTAFPV